MRVFVLAGLICWCIAAPLTSILAQAEVTAWGNIEGIRLDGELIDFESSVAVVSSDWSRWWVTGKERQTSRYSRNGALQHCEVWMDSLHFWHTIQNTGRGAAQVDLDFSAHVDTTLAGIFYQIILPEWADENLQINLIEPQEAPIQAAISSPTDALLRASAKGIRAATSIRQLEIMLASTAQIIVKKISQPGGAQRISILIELAGPALRKGKSYRQSLYFSVEGTLDTSPLTLTLQPHQKGRVFDGMGGNFRLQNPETDPPVIDYCLENMRVAWARVELPWRLWQPAEHTDPTTTPLHPHVKRSMEMAKRLYDMGMPVLLADWSAPDWAIAGNSYTTQPVNGLWGNALDSSKKEQIYASLTSYILYLRQHYGVEVSMFSFNESDLGINVRQTGREHTELIKGLGAYMRAKGLNTKMLFGDTADITGWWFLKEGLADSTAHPFIGAVSFHSWRGWTDENLMQWKAAADQLGVPLIVGEGSIDAQAWRYPAIFEEPLYARNEIGLYVRMMALVEPQSILQWQLTADYSPLSGGGVFGNDSTELRPTQRFFNLRQLASTPAGLLYTPVSSSDSQRIIATALVSDNATKLALHLVNNGTTREVVLTGLPSRMKSLQGFVTDTKRQMVPLSSIPVSKGTARFTVDALSFVSLFSAP